MGTPQLTIVTDEAGTRTWFAWLGNAVEQLATVDLTALTTGRLAYIDCYRVIDTPAAAAITASRAPVLLKLGGDPLSVAIADAANKRHTARLSTGGDERRLRQQCSDLRVNRPPSALTITTIDLYMDGHRVNRLERILCRIGPSGHDMRPQRMGVRVRPHAGDGPAGKRTGRLPADLRVNRARVRVNHHGRRSVGLRLPC
jgi:hypothetical protein